jgi:hypothetical protein
LARIIRAVASPLETGGLTMFKNDMHKLYAAAEKITDKWGVLRFVYQQEYARIIAASAENIRGRVDPYFVNWMKDASPIEIRAWGDIRGRCTPMYPQFPLFNYFIDFANPYLKVGIELDGKQWHDAEKDRERDEFLVSVGWHIYRITGSEANKTVDLPHYPDEYDYDEEKREAIYEDYFMNSCEGITRAIDIIYFEGHNPLKSLDVCYRTLDKHRLADFEIGPESALNEWAYENHMKRIFESMMFKNHPELVAAAKRELDETDESWLK